MRWLLIILLLIMTSCYTIKNIDDTEHIWIGENGETFYD